jgi:hypothetical protein
MKKAIRFIETRTVSNYSNLSKGADICNLRGEAKVEIHADGK